MKETDSEEKAPIMGSWFGMYALVIGVLLMLIVFFYVFTAAFA
jgi:hypothetical protein